MITFLQGILFFVIVFTIGLVFKIAETIVVGKIQVKMQSEKVDKLVASVYRGALDLYLKIKPLGKE